MNSQSCLKQEENGQVHDKSFFYRTLKFAFDEYNAVAKRLFFLAYVVFLFERMEYIVYHIDNVTIYYKIIENIPMTSKISAKKILQ
jgi:hypothetical protein